MRRRRRVRVVPGLIAGGALLFAAAAAAETLSASGAVLSNVTVKPATADVSRTIDLSGDSADAFYVMAQMPDGHALQRTNEGFWVPWDGKTASLIDNRFTPTGNTVTYKILKEDLSPRFFPINITLAYRTGGVVKFGVFQIMPE